MIKITFTILIAIFFMSCAHNKDQFIKQEQWRKDLPIVRDDPTKPTFPKIKKGVLKNGLTIYVVEKHNLPIADIKLVFDNGSRKDQVGKEGQINLALQMLKEGAGKYDALELAENFANLGTEVLANTGKDYSMLSVGVLATNIEKSIELMALMAQKPLFNDNDFNRLKRQTLTSLISAKANPSYLASQAFFNMAYGKNNAYAHMSDGTSQSLEGLEVKDLKSAHKQFFGPNNACLIVVGDANFNHIKALANKYFSNWPKIAIKNTPVETPKALKNMQTALINRPQSPQSFLLVGHIMPSKSSFDWALLEVLQNILVGMPSSRLELKLREEKGWTYGVKPQLNPLKWSGTFSISTSIQNPFAIDAMKEILRQFDNLKNNLVSKDELESAKKNILLSFAARYSTLSQIANMIASQFVYNLAEDHDENMYKIIEKVTPQDIQNMAQKYLNKEQTIGVVVGDIDMLEASFKNTNMGEVIIQK